jgi:lipopolysaccharide biosynthesis glycosyltransferase
LDRVLFLDSDMFVMDDLAELWEIPLKQHTVGACRDVAVPFCSGPRGVGCWRELGIPRAAPYFNGGMLVIDLAQWRKGEITPKVLDYIEKSPVRLSFLHQEAMNAILWNDWQPLDARWNLLASYSGRSFERSPSSAWRNPGIVHFSGRMKPWRMQLGGSFYGPYKRLLDEITPLFPAPASTLGDKLCGLYDRRFRHVLFPFEQFLFRRRLL